MSERYRGQDLLKALKATAGIPGPTVVIPVEYPPIAFLRPVATEKGLINADDVRMLTNWRNRFVEAFLTEFKANDTRTANWLVDVVANNDRKILFMIDDLKSRTFGYMGLDYIDWSHAYGEADAVVKGGQVAPGIMKRTLQTLLAWAQGQLGLKELNVRVRSDNSALEFYNKVGFREIHRIPLRAIETPDMVNWVEDLTLENADLYLVHMHWQEANRK